MSRSMILLYVGRLRRLRLCLSLTPTKRTTGNLHGKDRSISFARCVCRIVSSTQFSLNYVQSHFRRIGRTNFFGYSRKPQHPSRSIAPEADVGALNEGFARPPIFPFMDRESKFPLHYAIHQDKTPNIVTIIQHLYARDPTIIHKPDDMGFTPIFMAAGSGNLLAARKLLEWDLRAELESHANAEGATPLETLFDEMTTIREFAETYNKRWDGHSDERLTVQYLLKQAMGLSVGSLKEYIKANKYGCTCNKCAGGWLSPRMRSRLISKSFLRTIGYDI